MVNMVVKEYKESSARKAKRAVGGSSQDVLNRYVGSNLRSVFPLMLRKIGIVDYDPSRWDAGRCRCVTGVPERKQKGLVMSRGPLQVCCEGVKEDIGDKRAQKRRPNMLSAPMLLEIFTSDLQKFLIAIGLTKRLMGRRRVAEAIPLIDRG